MNTTELESMTADEVGEWLRKKGISEDVADAFVGKCTGGGWRRTRGVLVVLSLGIAGLQALKR